MANSISGAALATLRRLADPNIYLYGNLEHPADVALLDAGRSASGDPVTAKVARELLNLNLIEADRGAEDGQAYRISVEGSQLIATTCAICGGVHGNCEECAQRLALG